MNYYTPNKHQQNIESHQLATKTCQRESMNHEGRGEIDMVISFRCFLWNCPMDMSVHALHSSSFDELVRLSSPLPKCLESGETKVT